jgi:hypothetical protein
MSVVYCEIIIVMGEQCSWTLWITLTHIEVGARRVKIGPMKRVKLNLSFDKLFSAWKIEHIIL